MAIHPTAIVDPAAEIGTRVEIGPYSIVEKGVTIGDGTRIANHAVIREGTRMGRDCQVFSNAVIGEVPQFIGFDPEIRTGLELGDRVVIRENVTLHRSIYEGKSTRIGSGVYLMVGSHVAHDCLLEDGVILTNNVMLAGHVEVQSHTYVGGGAAIHQFVRLGSGSMISGVARVTQDVAPFLMVSERDEVNGLNLLGLKRRGVNRDAIKQLKSLFHQLFHEPGNIREQAKQCLGEQETSLSPEAKQFLAFFQGGKRGFCGVKLKHDVTG